MKQKLKTRKSMALRWLEIDERIAWTKWDRASALSSKLFKRWEKVVEKLAKASVGRGEHGTTK